MNWKKKFSHGLNQGFDQSKLLLDKAKKQAIEIGEQTLLSADIKELRQKEDDLYRSLGLEIYTLLLTKGRTSVSVRTPEIKDKFSELETVISELDTMQKLVQKEEKKK